MAVCESCWTEASRRTALFGGATADHYRELLDLPMDERPWCPQAEPYVEEG